MKVALVTESLSERSGSRAPLLLAENLHRQGVVTDVYATDVLFSAETKRRLVGLGLCVAVVRRFFPRVFGRFVSELPVGFAFGWQIRQGDYDLISFHGSPDLIWGVRLLGGRPVVTTYYGTQYVGRFFFDPLIRLRTICLLRFSDFLVPISRFLKEELRHQFSVPPPKMDVIYPGIDSAVTAAAAGDVPEKVRSEKVRIFSLSRFVPYKGFMDLIRVFRNLVEAGLAVELVVAGTVVDPRHFRQMKAAAAGWPVTFVLNPNDGELATLYRDCDVYASASTWEGFGLTFLEAAALGKPALGLKRASIGEVVVDGRTGFLADSLEEFQDRLKKLVTEASLRRELGAAAREWARRFSAAASAAAYCGLFEKVAAGSRAIPRGDEGRLRP